MASLPPMHPYSMLLCNISKAIGQNREQMHQLGRMMGYQVTKDIEYNSLLFQKLEEDGKLSEFHVTDFGKALDFIGIPKAAELVKEYEEKHLRKEPSKSYNNDPPPYSTTQHGAGENYSNDVTTTVTSSDERFSEQISDSQDDKAMEPLYQPEPTSAVLEEDHDQVKGQLNSMDRPPKLVPFKKKYHTVNLSTIRKDYSNEDVAKLTRLGQLHN